MNLVLDHHLGLRLWIATFDSGAVTPSEGECSAGWTTIGDAMVSPPLTLDIEIPCDQFDEWYIFDDRNFQMRTFERFVNYGGFHLADVGKMADSSDSTWEGNGLDWLVPIQDRFWNQIERLSPVTYVASGDNDVVVTQRRSFIDAVCRSVR